MKHKRSNMIAATPMLPSAMLVVLYSHKIDTKNAVRFLFARASVFQLNRKIFDLYPVMKMYIKFFAKTGQLAPDFSLV
jgi:hypothetical protein